jgi:hypothetical protein
MCEVDEILEHMLLLSHWTCRVQSQPKQHVFWNLGGSYPIGVQDVGDSFPYHVSYFRLNELWSSILCPKLDGDDWHTHVYLMGECILFNIETLKVCTMEEIQNTRTMQWQCYAEVIVSQNESNDDCKVTQL